MKKDIIVCGVGGQGILTIAYVLDHAADSLGYRFKQCEVHGMSQRGGAVQSHLRISDADIYSDLIPKGEADMILSVEPLEALRYVDYLSPEGVIITSTAPFKNIPNYPEISFVETKLHEWNAICIDGDTLAKKAGSPHAQNTVMIGAASVFLGLPEEELRRHIGNLFASKGDSMVDTNIKAFNYGRDAVPADARTRGQR